MAWRRITPCPHATLGTLWQTKSTAWDNESTSTAPHRQSLSPLHRQQVHYILLNPYWGIGSSKKNYRICSWTRLRLQAQRQGHLLTFIAFAFY